MVGDGVELYSEAVKVKAWGGEKISWLSTLSVRGQSLAKPICYSPPIPMPLRQMLACSAVSSSPILTMPAVLGLHLARGPRASQSPDFALSPPLKIIVFMSTRRPYFDLHHAQDCRPYHVSSISLASRKVYAPCRPS